MGSTDLCSDPGTYYTGSYDELHMVQCTVGTVREPPNALTKDGVQFRVDVYIRYSANCSDPGSVGRGDPPEYRLPMLPDTEQLAEYRIYTSTRN